MQGLFVHLISYTLFFTCNYNYIAFTSCRYENSYGGHGLAFSLPPLLEVDGGSVDDDGGGGSNDGGGGNDGSHYGSGRGSNDGGGRGSNDGGGGGGSDGGGRGSHYGGSRGSNDGGGGSSDGSGGGSNDGGGGGSNDGGGHGNNDDGGGGGSNDGGGRGNNDDGGGGGSNDDGGGGSNDGGGRGNNGGSCGSGRGGRGNNDGGGGSNGGTYKRFTCSCALCFSTLIIFLIAASVIVLPAIRYTLGSPYNRSYGPTETHLIPFSRFLCQDLKLKINYDGSNDYNVSFSMLLSHPGLFTHETFSFSEKIVGVLEQHYLFHLQSGSQITVSACFIDGAAIIPLTGWYVVKGKEHGGRIITRSDIKSVVAEFPIFYNCSNSVAPFSYGVEDDDFYYLTFQAHSLEDLHLDVNVSLYSTHYSLHGTTITSSCDLSTSSNESICSVSVPLLNESFALLTIHPESSDVDWLDEIPLEIDCEPRVWVYIVPPLLLMCLLIFTSCCYAYVRECTFCYWARKNVKCRVFIFFGLLVIVLTSTFLGLRFTIGGSYSNEGQSYGPTDTRLIPFSDFFCESLSLQTNYNGSSEYNISFLMLSSQPLLFKLENHTFSERITAEIQQHYIFYMHVGSKVTVKACFVNSTAILPLTRLYIIKGVHGFSGGYLRSDITSVVAEFSISHDCAGSGAPFSYSIEDDDFYYFIFHSGALGFVPVLNLDVNMSFHSTHYSLYDAEIEKSCTLSTSDSGSVCTQDVPLTKGYALLSIQPVYEVDELDQVSLETYCHPRILVYILLPGLCTLACAVCCVSYFLLRKKIKRCCKATKLKRLCCKAAKLKRLCCKTPIIKSKGCIICYCIPYLLLAVTIGIVLGLCFTVGSYHHSESYGPTDTHLIPLSNTFCQSVSLKTRYSGSDQYKFSFGMLFSQPGFIAHENFTISERVLGTDEHHYRFYMHSGSEFTVKTCFVNSAVIVPFTYLYLVRGDGYDGEYLNSGSKSVIDAYNIQYACTKNVTEFSFSIESADFYYLVLYTDTPSVLYLEVEMSFYRVHYATYDDSVTSSCALLSSNYGSVCSLDVPLRTNSYALLTISPASSNVAVDRFDEIPIETYCEPRLWVFIVPPLFLLGILIPACCCCYWNLHYKQFLCCNVKCICYCIPYLLVIFLVSIFLGLRFTIAVSYSNEGQSYGPIDTRLIPFSKTFCQSLSLQSNYNGSDEYDISFFMLSSKPLLFELENHTISETIAAKIRQQYLFYMHSGSHITVHACFAESTEVVPFTSLYIVKGIHEYNGGYLKSDTKSIVAEFAISYDCENNSLSYHIEDDDFYYLIFQASVFGMAPVLHLNVIMSFSSTHYIIEPNSITSSCTINLGSKCSLSVPLSSRSYALLSIHPLSSNVNLLDEIPLETSCEPRLWVYIVPPLLLLGILISACCCCYWRHNCKQYLCNAKCRRIVRYCSPYLLVIVLIIISLGLRFTIGVSYSNEGQSYGPTDTRLIPFSNLFCKSLSLQTNYNDSDEYDISFFMLSSKPLLFELENHTISETIAAKIRQQYLFYMHSGSHITVHACFAESTEVVPFTSLYIVKGIHEYNGGYLKSDTKSIVAEFAISYDCENNSLSYHIEDDDFYYLIFQASVFGMAPVLHLNVIMSFNSTHYTIQPNSTVDSCTINFGSACSLSVPLSSERYALLSIHPLSSNINLLEKIPLDTHCNPRLWVYVLPPVALMLLLSTCAISCYARKCCYACKKTVTVQLASGHELNFVRSKFKQDWIEGIAPDVKAVFAINNKTLTKWKWLAYRLLRGRREWYYHGTKICCNIRSSQHLCKGADCGICGISRFGFKKSKIRDPNTTFQRFGPGFYLAPNSSKAADKTYTQGSKAILLCDVRPGKKLRLKSNINKSPVPWWKWHQSIYGEPGVDLNYAEIVLSNPAAILPKYIVIF
jgi:hypothetical protein